MEFNVRNDKFKYIQMRNWKRLSLKQKHLLYIFTKKYLKNKTMYGSKCAIISSNFIQTLGKYKFYKCLVAQFLSDELGNFCDPHNSIIVTDLNDNIILRIANTKTCERLKQTAQIHSKDFIKFEYISFNASPIEEKEILSFINNYTQSDKSK